MRREQRTKEAKTNAEKGKCEEPKREAEENSASTHYRKKKRQEVRKYKHEEKKH